MSNQKRNIMYIALLIVGTVLYAAGSLGYIDSFWSGMGGAIIGVSVVRLADEIGVSDKAETPL